MPAPEEVPASQHKEQAGVRAEEADEDAGGRSRSRGNWRTRRFVQAVGAAAESGSAVGEVTDRPAPDRDEKRIVNRPQAGMPSVPDAVDADVGISAGDSRSPQTQEGGARSDGKAPREPHMRKSEVGRRQRNTAYMESLLLPSRMPGAHPGGAEIANQDEHQQQGGWADQMRADAIARTKKATTILAQQQSTSLSAAHDPAAIDVPTMKARFQSMTSRASVNPAGKEKRKSDHKRRSQTQSVEQIDAASQTEVPYMAMTGAPDTAMTLAADTIMAGAPHTIMAGDTHTTMAGAPHTTMDGATHTTMAGAPHTTMAGALTGPWMRTLPRACRSPQWKLLRSWLGSPCDRREDKHTQVDVAQLQAKAAAAAAVMAGRTESDSGSSTGTADGGDMGDFAEELINWLKFNLLQYQHAQLIHMNVGIMLLLAFHPV
ncbi:hypothetical protein Pmar_PMAR020420 [Perkinsus marinus ATCC 50983]|uniref:Uncharacterized protein n=1 Tax=Perkinsus marinus (strain ATCC 50983 / TXsc) TaxID=423536 RepID=C5L6Z9_PERM5|nr:hypothetical protein Pmar_PMAR020420 [Perkinsus marinus ATCC 50983]EER07261.1 hypothetical protein Pmar_PMAR020420 [Perkinsus marinus ATCC 50983]|eukprot:XP_002775445.1 hypothetical protein Pmar_PMAR020420 [Perkinsus marinus ATCC 50983]